jgi:hypothetical protein
VPQASSLDVVVPESELDSLDELESETESDEELVVEPCESSLVIDCEVSAVVVSVSDDDVKEVEVPVLEALAELDSISSECESTSESDSSSDSDPPAVVEFEFVPVFVGSTKSSPHAN